MLIRKTELSDAFRIAEIYNFYVLNSHATFEIEPVEVAEMERRIRAIAASYPYLVADDRDGEGVIGYAHANLYKSRAAYGHSAEISIYVRDGLGRRGVGTALYERLFDELKRTDVHAIIGGISLPNDASVRLHERFGMRKVAQFEQVGRKFDRWIDVGYWQKFNGE